MVMLEICGELEEILLLDPSSSLGDETQQVALPPSISHFNAYYLPDCKQKRVDEESVQAQYRYVV